MAFDINDPETKAAIEEITEGLKLKNSELLGEVKKLKKGTAIDPAELEKLEAELEQANIKIRDADKASKKLLADLDTATKTLQAESGFTQKLLIENGLTAELAKNGVTSPHLLKAAVALHRSGAQVVVDGENRVAKIGDKTMSDFVKEWAGSDEGKHFVTAAGNSGGGSNGGSGKGDAGKVMTRAAFSGMNPSQKSEFSKTGGTLTD